MTEYHQPDTEAVTFVSKLGDYYHTLRHITPVQLFYQIKYRLKKPSSLRKIRFGQSSVNLLNMPALPSVKKIIKMDGANLSVTLLNQTVTYSGGINWADEEKGRLWNYHLQYADFLKQDDLSAEFREELTLDLYQWLTDGKLRPEPYPASLRMMNVIRFISKNRDRLEKETDLVDSVYSELHFLKDRLEYHLMGNHLMENAFALLMGGFFFEHSGWKELAKTIFEEQIPEQILEDGAHFERSTMYHQILLFRFLEATSYLPPDSEFSSVFLRTPQKMLAWTDKMSFRNGDLARFNDATYYHTFTKREIFELAERCGLQKISGKELSESGFRRFETYDFELLIDSAGIAPSYQPGHAHASSLSFILYFQGQPVITDPGVSTYEPGERRDWERSTQAHNTVTLNQQNTAGVWGQFRVGRRPEVSILKETESEISIQLQHKLKSGERFEHVRNFLIESNSIEITDEVNLQKPVEGRLYLDPSITFKTLNNQSIELSNGLSIHFKGIQRLPSFTYEYCKGFNLLEKANGIEYNFTRRASFKIVSPKA